MSAAGQIPEEVECSERVDILRVVASDIEDILRRKLEETDISDVECREYFGRYVACEVGKKYMEISESVAEGFEVYCSEICEEENLDEERCSERCEKEYEEAYEEELERINEENVIDIRAFITTPECTVRISPLECDGDWCIVGAQVEVVFEGDIAQLKDSAYRSYWLNKVAEVIATILREL
jgi:hypothetical protein